VPFNVLLLPLLAGYFFVAFCKRLKYYHQRIDRQKLIFNSALAGFIFLALSFLIISSLKYWGFFPEYIIGLEKEYKLPHFAIMFFTLALSWLVTVAVNLFYNETKALSLAIKHEGSEFEKLCLTSFEAFNNSQLLLLSLHLKDRDVLIGTVTKLNEPKHSDFICILPSFKGYREESNKRVVLTKYLGAEDETFTNEIQVSIQEIVYVELFNPEESDISIASTETQKESIEKIVQEPQAPINNYSFSLFRF